MPATPVWLAAAEALLNRGLQTSAAAAELARRLESTSLQVDVAGIASIRAGVTAGRLVLGDGRPGADASAPNATLSGSPLALMRLAGASDAGRGSTAQVRGDAEIANLYRRLFAAARPDWEEEVSRIVGDLAARRLSQFARRAAAWAGQVRRSTGRNVAEYLQEESRDLVNTPELEEFLRGVDDLREASDRLEARLARLEQRLSGGA